MLKEYETYNLFNLNDYEFRSNFVERLPNSKELDKNIKMQDLIEEFSLKVYGKKNILVKEIIGIDYIDSLGYCMLIKNQDNYTIIRFSKDPLIAFKEIIINILYRKGVEFEKANRDNDREYDSNLFIIEYSIEKWCIYYDNKLPKDIINYYKNKLDSLELENIKKIFTLK